MPWTTAKHGEKWLCVGLNKYVWGQMSFDGYEYWKVRIIFFTIKDKFSRVTNTPHIFFLYSMASTFAFKFTSSVTVAHTLFYFTRHWRWNRRIYCPWRLSFSTLFQVRNSGLEPRVARNLHRNKNLWLFLAGF